MIILVVFIGIAIVYGAGYSAGKQSIRDQIDKIMNRKRGK